MDNQKLSERLSAPPDCAECNGKGYAELIDGWERPCDACRGEGFVMDKAEQPTITQADRDAAAAYWKVSMIGSSMTQKLYKSGEFDSSLIVQAFARHRTTSLAAQDGLVEALERVMHSTILDKAHEIASDALSAIKEQHHD